MTEETQIIPVTIRSYQTHLHFEGVLRVLKSRRSSYLGTAAEAAAAAAAAASRNIYFSPSFLPNYPPSPVEPTRWHVLKIRGVIFKLTVLNIAVTPQPASSPPSPREPPGFYNIHPSSKAYSRTSPRAAVTELNRIPLIKGIEVVIADASTSGIISHLTGLSRPREC